MDRKLKIKTFFRNLYNLPSWMLNDSHWNCQHFKNGMHVYEMVDGFMCYNYNGKQHWYFCDTSGPADYYSTHEEAKIVRELSELYNGEEL